MANVVAQFALHHPQFLAGAWAAFVVVVTVPFYAPTFNETSNWVQNHATGLGQIDNLTTPVTLRNDTVDIANISIPSNSTTITVTSSVAPGVPVLKIPSDTVDIPGFSIPSNTVISSSTTKTTTFSVASGIPVVETSKDAVHNVVLYFKSALDRIHRFLYEFSLFRVSQDNFCPVLTWRWLWRTPIIALLTAILTIDCIDAVWAWPQQKGSSAVAILCSIGLCVVVLLCIPGVDGLKCTQDYIIIMITAILLPLASYFWNNVPAEVEEAIGEGFEDARRGLSQRIRGIWGHFHVFGTNPLGMTFADGAPQSIAQQQSSSQSQPQPSNQARTLTQTPTVAAPTRLETDNLFSPFQGEHISAADALRAEADRMQERKKNWADLEESNAEIHKDSSDIKADEPVQANTLSQDQTTELGVLHTNNEANVTEEAIVETQYVTKRAEVEAGANAEVEAKAQPVIDEAKANAETESEAYHEADAQDEDSVLVQAKRVRQERYQAFKIAPVQHQKARVQSETESFAFRNYRESTQSTTSFPSPTSSSTSSKSPESSASSEEDAIPAPFQTNRNVDSAVDDLVQKFIPFQFRRSAPIQTTAGGAAEAGGPGTESNKDDGEADRKDHSTDLPESNDEALPQPAKLQGTEPSTDGKTSAAPLAARDHSVQSGVWEAPTSSETVQSSEPVPTTKAAPSSTQATKDTATSAVSNASPAMRFLPQNPDNHWIPDPRQFELPDLYRRPQDRPETGADSLEQFRNRLVGPSTLTNMRREKEAAAGSDSSQGPSGPPGPPGPSSSGIGLRISDGSDSDDKSLLPPRSGETDSHSGGNAGNNIDELPRAPPPSDPSNGANDKQPKDNENQKEKKDGNDDDGSDPKPDGGGASISTNAGLSSTTGKGASDPHGASNSPTLGSTDVHADHTAVAAAPQPSAVIAPENTEPNDVDMEDLPVPAASPVDAANSTNAGGLGGDLLDDDEEMPDAPETEGAHATDPGYTAPKFFPWQLPTSDPAIQSQASPFGPSGLNVLQPQSNGFNFDFGVRDGQLTNPFALLPRHQSLDDNPHSQSQTGVPERPRSRSRSPTWYQNVGATGYASAVQAENDAKDVPLNPEEFQRALDSYDQDTAAHPETYIDENNKIQSRDFAQQEGSRGRRDDNNNYFAPSNQSQNDQVDTKYEIDGQNDNHDFTVPTRSAEGARVGDDGTNDEDMFDDESDKEEEAPINDDEVNSEGLDEPINDDEVNSEGLDEPAKHDDVESDLSEPPDSDVDILAVDINTHLMNSEIEQQRSKFKSEEIVDSADDESEPEQSGATANQNLKYSEAPQDGKYPVDGATETPQRATAEQMARRMAQGKFHPKKPKGRIGKISTPSTLVNPNASSSTAFTSSPATNPASRQTPASSFAPLSNVQAPPFRSNLPLYSPSGYNPPQPTQNHAPGAKKTTGFKPPPAKPAFSQADLLKTLSNPRAPQPSRLISTPSMGSPSTSTAARPFSRPTNPPIPSAPQPQTTNRYEPAYVFPQPQWSHSSQSHQPSQAQPPWNLSNWYTDRAGSRYEIDYGYGEARFYATDGQNIAFDEEKFPVDAETRQPWLG